VFDMARCWAGGRCNHPAVKGLKGITVMPGEFGLPCPPNPRLCPWRSLVGSPLRSFSQEDIKHLFNRIINDVKGDDNVENALKGASLLKEQGVIDNQVDWALGYLMGVAWGSLLTTVYYEALRQANPEEIAMCRELMRDRVTEIKRCIEKHIAK